MPLERNGKKLLVPSSRDGIDSLPDGMLEHILGFLEAQEAVRMCVLAKCWRQLWKSASAMRIISVSNSNMTRLELRGVVLNSSFCDFSNSPSLQHLDNANCYLYHAKKISSESLKGLSITNCIFSKEFRTLIDIPLLIYTRGICYSSFIFSWDLNWCPMFSKLKALLLDESWCVTPDFQTLTCILKNSLSMERSAAISGHLKAIEIKCQVVDEAVSQVLKFLCKFNICM
ncbi:hypothetical protein SORBI_3005G078066 [Sorghum bicolor]|uniref:F-box domain-containing protein n=1 Tax=Sorghum bicolor TaxID=4558 RepID=A0A1Z5RH79_SORBI|nr:hypothetical protein SORBI_3005G078066 [Sorghum bicolor]